VTQTTLFTHTDLDGVGCAVLFAATRPDHGPAHLVENGAIDERVSAAVADRMAAPAEHEVLVTDHGVSEDVAARIDAFVAAGGTFALLDHHRSSAHLASRPWATVDERRSATGLLFQHLGRPPMLAEFVRLVEDHDLWLHRDERSARLAALHGMLGHERFLARFAANPEVRFSEGERLLLDVEQARRNAYLDKKVGQARVLERGRVRWAVCYAEQHQSDLAERMMNDLDVVATAIVNTSKRTVSLRGRGYDVSTLAQRYGGGGHSRAAAFTFRDGPLEADLLRFERALDAVLG
jgi:oligoribonuclease NrnB/cAMP/cGMP phosphodiesterase (DHH superfamily)